MNEEENFLLKLHLCQVSLKNELRVAHYIMAYKRCPTKKEFESLLDLENERKEQLWDQVNSEDIASRAEFELSQAKVLTILDKRYPSQLQEIYDPPVVLFYRGNIALLNANNFLGVVGARNCSMYAFYTIRRLLPPVIKKDVVIVSGLAKGVDGYAHRICLDNKGKAIAILGNGLDVFYPECNHYLQDALSHKGLLLTEYPSGTHPLKYHFPLRNRIIAGLCQSLLVVEAKQRSGSLITANLALQNDRNVLAIPGRLSDPNSVGCNELIAAGAKAVLSSEDIMEEFVHF